MANRLHRKHLQQDYINRSNGATNSRFSCSNHKRQDTAKTAHRHLRALKEVPDPLQIFPDGQLFLRLPCVQAFRSKGDRDEKDFVDGCSDEPGDFQPRGYSHGRNQ
jgi:hypothetical protein